MQSNLIIGRPGDIFYADSNGIYFPNEYPETRNTEWLLVPWEKIGRIKKEKFTNLTEGPTIEIRLNDSDINQYFRNVKLTNQLLSGNRNIQKKGSSPL